MASKMMTCKTCGEEIAKSAKICPKCGAKQKKHTVLGVILVIFGVLLISAAIGGGGDEEPKKVGDSSSSQSQDVQDNESSSAEPEKVVFQVGEKAELNDIIVSLVDVSENSGGNYMTPEDGKVFVVCEFDVENNSEKDIAVSSMLSFEAYFDDYSTGMNLSAMLSTGKDQLDGSVASGKKMRGVIGYEVAPEWANMEIRFKPDFWSGKEFTFEYSK